MSAGRLMTINENWDSLEVQQHATSFGVPMDGEESVDEDQSSDSSDSESKSDSDSNQSRSSSKLHYGTKSKLGSNNSGYESASKSESGDSQVK